MPKIATLGEVMIELAPVDTTNDKLKSVSFAGDSYNTAITLSRLGIETGYVTRLGKDNYSSQILSFLEAENVNTQAIEHCDKRQPGLYMIQNIEGGERIFHYWRDQSAAKQLLSTPDARTQIQSYLVNCEWLYFSAISVAILENEYREDFFGMLEEFKHSGGKVAYDSNFRPKLWSNIEDARQCSLRCVQLSDLALLTLDDEAELWGNASPLEQAKARYEACKQTEIVFKRGADDIYILSNGREVKVPVKPVQNIVDTTAAGDTFNAGYLASHLNGGNPEDSALLGSLCAGVIIQHRGGVIDKNVFLDGLKSST